MSPKFGWGLSTVPQQHLNGRRVPLPRGRVIGGTGSINGMAYFRGPAKDFDDWAAMGNPGWSYADLLPYFLRSEHNPEYAGSPYHATGGPMGVSFPTSRNRALRCLQREHGVARLQGAARFQRAGSERLRLSAGHDLERTPRLDGERVSASRR